MENNDHHTEKKLFNFLKLKRIKMLLNYKWKKKKRVVNRCYTFSYREIKADSDLVESIVLWERLSDTKFFMTYPRIK